MNEFAHLKPPPLLLPWLNAYPPGVFDDALYQSVEWADRYVLELSGAVLARLGVLERLADGRTATELCTQAGWVPAFARPLDWLLRRLTTAGHCTEHAGYYRLSVPLPSPALAELRAAGLAIDPSNQATLALLDAAAAAYPAVAHGQSGKEALLGMGQLGLWLAYFDNAHRLYAINNTLTAHAAAARLHGRGDGLRILELGAGAGSAGLAVLAVLTAQGLAPAISQYHCTEPNAFFRRRGERALKAHYPGLPLTFGTLDINRPWREQGLDGEFDLVYAVNVLHIADDLLFSLREARAVLSADGWLVAGECLRPFAGQPLYTEFVFQLLEEPGVRLDPDYRPTPGFLTPEQWQAALARAGFAQSAIAPPLAEIRTIYPRFITGAVCAGSDTGCEVSIRPLRSR